MDRNTLLSVIREQQAHWGIPSHVIPRLTTADTEKYSKSAEIVVITGIRRCGKSTLLNQIRSKQKERDYFLNFDDERLIRFSVNDFQLLWELFIEEFGEQHTFYFDEIQNIPGWERFVRQLHDNRKKVYVTGSNATMLSKELGTHLTGRYIPIRLFPLSFKEIVQTKLGTTAKLQAPTTVLKGKLMRLFQDYKKDGGFPGYLNEKNPEYLKTLYESILYRDVIVRFNLNNERPIKELAFYVASNIGKDMSFSRVSQLIGLTNPNTLKNYCGYLESVYLLFVLYKYDPSLRKQIVGTKKPYLIDPALINTIGFRPSPDDGRILENIVFLELLRQGHDIFFHQGNSECDFVLRKGTRIIAAIQVCKTLQDPETKQREIAGLAEAMEKHKLKSGLILTEDEEGSLKKPSIQIQPIWKWLLK